MKRYCTINDIACYLPYGLEFACGHKLIGLQHSYRPLLVGEEFKQIDLDCSYLPTKEEKDVQLDMISWNPSVDMCQPVLRPLEQLCVEINHRGEKVVPILEMFKIAYFNTYNCQPPTNRKIVVEGGRVLLEGNLNTMIFWYSGCGMFMMINRDDYTDIETPIFITDCYKLYDLLNFYMFDYKHLLEITNCVNFANLDSSNLEHYVK